MDNYIEEIFLTLEKLKLTERGEIERVLNLLAEKLSQPICEVLSHESKIIWSDVKTSVRYYPLSKKFLLRYSAGNTQSLSDLPETSFWNSANEIIKWVTAMRDKLNIILADRQETIQNFQNMKSAMIQCEKEGKYDLGLGFFKNDTDNN